MSNMVLFKILFHVSLLNLLANFGYYMLPTVSPKYYRKFATEVVNW